MLKNHIRTSPRSTLTPIETQLQNRWVQAHWVVRQIFQNLTTEPFYQTITDLIATHAPEGSSVSVGLWLPQKNSTWVLVAQSSPQGWKNPSPFTPGQTREAPSQRFSPRFTLSKDSDTFEWEIPLGLRSELEGILQWTHFSPPLARSSNQPRPESTSPTFSTEWERFILEYLAQSLAAALELRKLSTPSQNSIGDRITRTTPGREPTLLFKERTPMLSSSPLCFSRTPTQTRKAEARVNLSAPPSEACPGSFPPSDLSSEIIGQSPSLMNILSMVDKIAPTDAPVLIQGESGTGKELIARRLHNRSTRALHPYVVVSCGTLQESLLESELFGHEKGAFTGATHQKIGLAEAAHSGTLFLDEIGELSLGIQSKLLRFLQEGEFYRIGGKAPIRVQVRILSATNKDLETEVQQGRFRKDLFYRLNTITLPLPPLRRRKEDIPALADFFLKNSRFGKTKHSIKRIQPQALHLLQHYPWPGNIRELQNTMERIKILSENSEIRSQDIPLQIRSAGLTTEALDPGLELSLEEVEKNHILRTLAHNHGNKTKTARVLKITIKTLYNKLHSYGILARNPPSPEGG
ncbi:MAG: sigma-54 interaction domain-containing protein [Bdellovibrionia bacterium]